MKTIWVLAALLVVVLATLAWVVVRRRSADAASAAADKPQSLPSKPPTKRPPDTWGKTVVVPDPAKACPAVLAIQGKSFPNDDAPRLPLSACSVATCQCHFVPAKERRASPERRSQADRRGELRFEPGKEGDRRSGKDRRRKGYDWHQTI